MKTKQWYLPLLLWGVLCASCQQNKRSIVQYPIIANLQLDSTLLAIEELQILLDVPWDLTYGPDGHLWFTEQGGKVSRMNVQTGDVQEVLNLDSVVFRQRTTGLLSMALYPDFDESPYVFLNYTVLRNGQVFTRLERYRFENGQLRHPLLLSELTGNTGHNGSRITIGPDRTLFWATGDAHRGENAQHPDSLNGKVLRMHIDGRIPADNPDPASYVWAKGFRNIQGMVFSPQGLLYTSEHGDAIEDEVNLIEKGGNYGWPAIEGIHDLPSELDFAKQHGTLAPLISWTPVIAPAGLEYYGHESIPEWENALLLGTLKGQSLRVIKLTEDGKNTLGESVFFLNRYGRIRDVCTGADGSIYMSTSNRDWNPGEGFPKTTDDRILRIRPTEKAAHIPFFEDVYPPEAALQGEGLYQLYCASCHKADGSGLTDIFPALAGSAVLQGHPENLVGIIMNGLATQSSAGQAMPSFNFLKDEEIATITNYVIQQWGVGQQPVSAAYINQMRTAKTDQ